MQVDFSAPILDLNGQPLVDDNGPVNLGVICLQALLANHDEDRNLSGLEKVRRFNLATEIHANKIVNVSAEDIALLKQLVARSFIVLVTGRAWALLDP